MGWANCGTDSNGRPIGYAHEATCDHPECNAAIHRGLSYACGECTAPTRSVASDISAAITARKLSMKGPALCTFAISARPHSWHPLTGATMTAFSSWLSRQSPRLLPNPLRQFPVEDDPVLGLRRIALPGAE